MNGLELINARSVEDPRLALTRDTLRGWLEGDVEDAAVNRILARLALQPQWRDGELVEVPVGDPEWLEAWTAARDIVSRRGPRLKRCANPECILWFEDTSRGGQRRWCSMAVCGNREKVRRHQKRHAS